MLCSGEVALKEEIREGYYKDKNGEWQVDRRSGKDRRHGKKQGALDHERRRLFRRKADRELFDKDHKTMIDEALQEFAEDHGGHL